MAEGICRGLKGKRRQRQLIDLSLYFQFTHRISGPHTACGGVSGASCGRTKERGTGVCTSDAPCPKREPAITQRADAKSSTLRPRLQTTRPDKHQGLPAWGIARPSQAARCARTSTEFRGLSSAPSLKLAFSPVSSTSPLGASTPMVDTS